MLPTLLSVSFQSKKLNNILPNGKRLTKIPDITCRRRKIESRNAIEGWNTRLGLFGLSMVIFLPRSLHGSGTTRASAGRLDASWLWTGLSRRVTGLIYARELGPSCLKFNSSECNKSVV